MREYISSEQGGQPKKDDDPSGLSDALLQLKEVSLSMRSDGSAIFGFTTGNLAFAVASLFLGPWSLLLAGSVISGLIALAIAVVYESWRKQGDALFEEISDELQWNIRGTRLLQDKSLAEERPALQARVILRAFARASDLPLIPGRLGPAVYVVVNLLIPVLLFLLQRVFTS